MLSFTERILLTQPSRSLSWRLGIALKAVAIAATMLQASHAAAFDDTDEDGLLDLWEKFGYDANNDGVIDVDLPALGANPLRKDIFVEIDFMVLDLNGDGDGADFGEHSHEPTADAIRMVVDMFASAPVTNPDGTLGITAHIDKGDLGGGNPVPHSHQLDFTGETVGHRHNPAVAVDASGNFPALTWEDDRDRNGVSEIFVRRLSSAANVQGNELTVNSTSSGQQRAPAIGADMNGHFVVVWEDDADGNGKYEIRARGFFATAGEAFGDMTVNTQSAGQQLQPAIGMSPSGAFVVAWEDDQDGNEVFQILARGFNPDGSQRFADITVNSVDDGDQRRPAVAMDASGGVVVVWEDDQDGNGKYQVLARGFNADGTQRFADITVNTEAAGQQRKPAAAMDSTGRFIVAWEDDQDGNGSFEIMARGFNADGSQRFADITVNTVSAGQQLRPAVGMDPATGNFTMSWEDDQDGNGRYEILARGLNVNGSERFETRTVNTVSARDQLDPSVAMDANGNGFVAWEDDRDGSTYFEIYARGYDSAGVDSLPEFLAHGKGTTEDFYTVKGTNFNPTRAPIFHYGLFVHKLITPDASGRGEVGGNDVIIGLGSSSTELEQAVVLAHELGHNLTLKHGGREGKNYKPNYNSIMNYRYSGGADDSCDAAGDDVVDFSRGTRPPLVETSLNEVAGMCNGFLRINTQSREQQRKPAVASNAAGDFVVVWADDQDGNGKYEILARGFAADGTELFADMSVNTVASGQQDNPSIGMDTTGRFVVAWEDDQDGNGKYEVMARGFNADGTERFTTRTINSAAAGQQLNPAVAMDPTGRFAVAWEDDQDGNGLFQILARGFDADGSERFADVTVNTVDDGQQLRPDVAMRSDAQFVVVWEDDQDGNGKYEILARGFDANGAERFTDITINTVDDGQQRKPAVAMDAVGRFVVAWQDDQDGNGKYQIFVRGFDVGGDQLFGDTTVNVMSGGQQINPDTTLNAQGQFLVVFEDDQDGDGRFEILARSFSDVGAELAPQFTVNLVSSGDQVLPKVVNNGSGASVVVWEDDRDRNGKFEIHGRMIDFMGHALNQSPIDWNEDGAFGTGVSQDINDDEDRNTLSDFDDWAHVVLHHWGPGGD